MAVMPRTRQRATIRSGAVAAGAVLTVLVLLLAFFDSRELSYPSPRPVKDSTFDKVQQCAIKNLHIDLSFLDDVKPITAAEFIDRRDRLAQALVQADADAFVLEPGYTFQ